MLFAIIFVSQETESYNHFVNITKNANFNSSSSPSNSEIGELEWNFTTYDISFVKNGSYNIFEGDIILFNPPPSVLEAAPDEFKSFSMKWQDAIIPYEIDPLLEKKPLLFNNLKSAIRLWDNQTTVTFIELNNTNALAYPDYVRFQYHPGICLSPVGQNITGGEQSVYLSPVCPYGKILHEIGHTLGLWHEQSRPDWRDFISINFSNVRNGSEINFNSTRCKNNICESPDPSVTPYDYCSIMHYGPRDFIRDELRHNPDAYTIKPLKKFEGCELGQRIAPSQYDIIAINTIYR